MQRLAALVALLALTHCTSATLQRAGGPDLEAEIVGGDRDFVYVSNEAGQIFQVPRSSIVDVDHPGNPLMVASLPFILTAAVFWAVSSQSNCQTANCRDAENSFLQTMGLFYGAAGAAMLAGGAIPWFRSTGNAASDAGLPPGLRADFTAVAPAKANPEALPRAASEDLPPLAEPVSPTTPAEP